MLSFSGALKIYVALDALDMRKSHNGLHAAVVQQLGMDPQSGALFAFSNRRRTRLKILYWDGTGLWVLSKRLENGSFSWPKPGTDSTKAISLDPTALAMLTDGIDLRDGCRRPWYQRS